MTDYGPRKRPSKWFWYIGSVLFGFAILAIGLLLTVNLFGGFSMADCSEDSPAAEYARDLPQERLARLYGEIKAISESENFVGRVSINSERAPTELSDLEYGYLVADSPRYTRIMLEGCFDHHVVLRFMGLEGEEPPSIILTWGEGPGAGQEQLWPMTGIR